MGANQVTPLRVERESTKSRTRPLEIVSIDRGIPLPDYTGFKRGELRQAIDALRPGDSVLVSGGVYRSIVAAVNISNRDHEGERRFTLRTEVRNNLRCVRIWRVE